MNGSITDTIRPTRGLRQGNPRSPYLFIICLDVLLRNFEHTALQKMIKPLHASRSGLIISAFTFVDDFIIFSTADKKYIYLISIIHKFCIASRQSLNYSKFGIYFSPCTSKFQRRQAKNIFSIRKAKHIEKYLGLPLITGRTTKTLFREVVSKMEHRLNI